MTLSLKAGSGSCMEVFSLTHIEPSFALNISFHLFNCSSGAKCRQEHSTPFSLSSFHSSFLQSQTYMYPFLSSSSAYA